MDDCTIVIIGITGDLAQRKLIPALYELIATGTLERFILVGASPDETTMCDVLASARRFIPSYLHTTWQTLCCASHYVRLEASNNAHFKDLAARIRHCEHEHGLSGNRLVYCATASELFCPITHNCVKEKILVRGARDPWHRIVYEKPFGHDYASAHEINTFIAGLLDEEHLYRVDHYLTEELVSNIALVRFTNCVFEPLWNNRYISFVNIVLHEKVGIGNRGAYYDAYGALKDMIQSHALELLALTAMEPPEKLTGEHIRSKRAEVLRNVRVADVLLGQYEGYLDEPNVRAHSHTETFAAVTLSIDNNPRWAGVPFCVRTGKCLEHKETAIRVHFKDVACLLARDCPREPNCLTIEVVPDPSFALTLNVKKPGLSQEVVPVSMEFCHRCVFKGHRAEPYETLIEEVIRGQKAVAVRFDEIEYAWRVIDAVKERNLPVYQYAKASHGPAELEIFEQCHALR